jgi:hypothetical protein
MLRYAICMLLYYVTMRSTEVAAGRGFWRTVKLGNEPEFRVTARLSNGWLASEGLPDQPFPLPVPRTPTYSCM